MSKAKKLLILCAALAGAGLLLVAVGIGMGGRVTGIRMDSDGLHVLSAENNSGSSKSPYQEEEKTLEKFTDMDIELNCVDFSIELSDHYGIAYKLNRNDIFDCEVKDGKLKVSQKYPDNSGFSFQWFYFGGLWEENLDQEPVYVVLSIPEGAAFGSVQINSDSGKVSVGELQADSLEILAEYGDIALEHVQGAAMNLESHSGTVDLEQVKGEELTLNNQYGDSSLIETTITGKTKVQMDSGELKLKNCLLGSLDAVSVYGDFMGEGLKVTNTNITMDSGECRIDSLEAENIDINSEYGNVILKLIHPIDKYYYNLITEYGMVRVDEKEFGERYQSMEEKANKITVNCASGDIEIN